MLAWALCSLFGCAAATDAVDAGDRGQAGMPVVAVFPVENLSARTAPLGEVRRLFIERLTSYGLRVLDDAVLERAVTQHRVRYTAGVEPGFAKALRQETGAEAILIPSLELYDDASPPRVALFARLVSTGDDPAVLWVDGTGAAGDDAPGILGVGLIEDPRALLARALHILAGSLVRHVSGAGDRAVDRPGSLRPKIVYRSEALDPTRRYTIAVVPFFNKSARKYAGEIVALHMIRNLMTPRHLAIVEPGIVREELLRFRVVMNDGISLSDTETILGAVNADLVLNGEVLEYHDPRGPSGAPVVDFSVLFIERTTRRVLYSSYSHHAGDDGVFFFDWGRVNTAHAMASAMARAIVEHMRLARPAAGAAPGSGAQQNRRR